MKIVIYSFLKSLSRIFRAITLIRNYIYDAGFLSSFCFKTPIICVGNLVVGGTGKTPLVIGLAKELMMRGYKPVVLSRGYGGSERGPRIVAASDDFREVGDEPLLIAHRRLCPVVVSRDRVSGARFIESNLDVSVIILDDGFQHRRLERKCNLVSFFVGSEETVKNIENADLLPYGRFREDRDIALNRADLIALNTRGGQTGFEAIDRVRKVLPKTIPTFLVDGVTTKPTRGGEELFLGAKVWIFCAIANPDSFVTAVKMGGYEVKGFSLFRDHHKFSDRELQGMKAKAELNGSSIFVCTEKDFVKLPESFKKDVWVVYIESCIPEGMVDTIVKLLGCDQLRG